MDSDDGRDKLLDEWDEKSDQDEFDFMKEEVDSKERNEQFVTFKEEDEDDWEMVTTDKEQVLHGEWTEQVSEIARLSSSKDFVRETQKLIFKTFIDFEYDLSMESNQNVESKHKMGKWGVQLLKYGTYSFIIKVIAGIMATSMFSLISFWGLRRPQTPFAPGHH